MSKKYVFYKKDEVIDSLKIISSNKKDYAQRNFYGLLEKINSMGIISGEVKALDGDKDFSIVGIKDLKIKGYHCPTNKKIKFVAKIE